MQGQECHIHEKLSGKGGTLEGPSIMSKTQGKYKASLVPILTLSLSRDLSRDSTLLHLYSLFFCPE
jgi:hypothetical protein